MYDNVEVNRKHNTFKLYVCIRRNYQTDVFALCFKNAWTDMKDELKFRSNVTSHRNANHKCICYRLLL